MKILITTPGLKFGGAERVLSILANQWCAMGHEVSFFITGDRVAPAYELSPRIRLQWKDPKKDRPSVYGTILAVRRCAKTLKPDVAVSFMQDVAALTAIALCGTGVPLVYSERNDPNRTNTRKKDFLMRILVEHTAKRFVFQTEGAKQCFRKRVQEKSRVILNPLDTASFPLHDFNNETNEVVAVGRLVPQKNYPLLFCAFAQISQDFPSVRLSIYGAGHLREQLEQLKIELGVDTQIQLMGEKADIHSRICTAKAFVMS